MGLEQVRLCRHQCRLGLRDLVVPEELNPGRQVSQGLGSCRVIDEDRSVGVSEVGRYQTFVLLLTCSVPKLQSDGPLSNGHISG